MMINRSTSNPAGKWRVVTGVIGSDPHSVGNRLVARVLEEAGYEVFNLGAMVPPDEFIASAREAAAHAILISSLSGFGEVYAREMRARCDEAGLPHVVLYMGGNVVNGRADWQEVEATFKQYGFDHVYPPQTRPEVFLPHLAADLKSRFSSAKDPVPAS
jgi:methylaspartate mutase sigma subunit